MSVELDWVSILFLKIDKSVVDVAQLAIIVVEALFGPPLSSLFGGLLGVFR